MSREIKFRFVFQHSATKDIVFLHFSLDAIVDREGVAIAEISTLRTEGWIIIARNQFIGLHDKNGKEIYEGDILKGGWENGDNYISKVVFANFVITDDNDCEHVIPGWHLSGAKTIACLHSMFCEEYREIIGNAHQNPELLNN